MLPTKKRVSVLRIPRQVLNPINSTENHDEQLTIQIKPRDHSHIDKTSINKKEQNNNPRTKTDIFTLSPPRRSDTKSEDFNEQTARTDSVRYSPIIQQQPIQTTTWVKNLPNNTTRPELNWVATGRWTHDICSLSTDWNMCCYACVCWCCFRHEISSMMGEHWCLWFLNCTPLMELRTKFRQQYNIQGSIFEDCCCATFCPLCVALQLANEGRTYGHRIFS